MSDSVSEIKNYAVIIRVDSAIKIGDRQERIARLSEVASSIMREAQSISERNPETIFTSTDIVTMGIFVNSSLPAGIIRARLTGDAGKRGGSILVNDDSVLVMEIGNDFSGFGNAIKYSWLQRVR
ncbi:hypothetical protein I6M38_11585 [Shewanella algae]|uniref:hypothetical protein n=1 Tax=Shewanella algae TaxID=38313 RepID=UPI001AACAB09|nr:hypothetical protein [Shewanella algae]MBO2552621.1 hypothetical protein [Shewanella algae]MBO2582515.1 hypothetical protein [Shewanella algae]